MPVLGCTTLAIEGTHAAGKTTLVHALTAYYRTQGLHAACLGEPARTSPFIDDIVIHGQGTFDLATEVDLFAAQLTSQLRTARHHEILFADKTIANVLAYARLVLDPAVGSHDAAVLDAMEQFCKAWAPTYDAVFYAHDHFDPSQPKDPYRSKVRDLQSVAHAAIRDVCVNAGLNLVDMPAGLFLEGRVNWVVSRVTSMGLDPEAPAPRNLASRVLPGDSEAGEEGHVKERYRSIVDVYVLLRRGDGSILLLERANTGYADGQLCPPSGHLEEGESVRDGAIREAKEEVGVILHPKDLGCVHVVHHRSPEGQGRVGFFFKATRWDGGEPVNCEPHKCAGLHWASPMSLTANTVPYTAAAIAQIQAGAAFSLDGWA